MALAEASRNAVADIVDRVSGAMLTRHERVGCLNFILRRTVLSLGIGIADALDAAYAAGIVPPRHQACKHLHDQARARQDSRFRTSESRGGQLFKPYRRGRYADTI